MRKRIKAFSLALLMCAALFTVPVFAWDVSEMDDFLTISDGVFTSAAAQPIQEAIDQYFELRECSGTQSIDTPLASPGLVDETDAREEAMRAYWERADYYIVDFENTAEITDASFIGQSQNVSVEIYEWTSLKYAKSENPDPSSVDESGFATIHELTLSPTEQGSYKVISDAYDEEDVTGYVSNDYVKLPVEDESEILPDETEEPVVEIMANKSYMPNPSQCFTYANLYVREGAYAPATNNDNAGYYDDYNSKTYGLLKGNDCCNYVSQCLRAGGFTLDPSSTSSRKKDSVSQWWHAEKGVLADSSCTWRLVEDFVDYWGSRYSKVAIKVNNACSNVYPGNPIITKNEGHIAICVGYNSSGEPIYNGHTRDVGQRPVSLDAANSDDAYYYTILLNCTGNHTKTYKSYSSEKHKVICSKCTKVIKKEAHTSAYKKYNDRQHILYCTKCNRNMSTAAAHVFTLSGAYYTCSVCGYKTTVKPELNAIIQPMYVERCFV